MKSALRILLPTLFAALLLVGLFHWGGVEASDLRGAWESLSLGAWLAALGLHLLVYNLRAVRYRLLIPAAHRPDHWNVLAISAGHNLATSVLPARTGDASLVLYLRAQCGVPVELGLAALLVSRLLDLATLALALGLACLAIGAFDPTQPAWMTPFGAGLLAAGGALLVLAAFADKLTRVATKVARVLRVDRLRLGSKLLDKIDEAGHALRELGRGPRFVGVALLTCGVWLGLFSMYSVLAFALGLPETLGFPEAVFGSGMAVVTNLLPINALAGFGTHEMGWAFGFSEVLGVPRDLALATGVGMHLVQLANVCLLGVLGHVAMGLLSAGRPAVDARELERLLAERVAKPSVEDAL
ncbi:MAG: flippase-like domain-containing protein [Planctomycetes bacterium]|nr:flippase-like domain-containing protein [Planctomycetota bacterium]